MFSYCLYALGPVLVFLHAELYLSYTLTSLHSGLWAVGTMLAGLGFPPLLRRVGRYRLFWLSAGGLVAGSLLLMVSHVVGATLLAVSCMGTSGTLLQTGCLALLSERHGQRRDRALVEASAGASAAAVLAPFVLGLLQSTPAGWRSGFWLPILGLGALFVTFARQPLATAAVPAAASPPSRPLPAAYWVLAVLVATVVAVEFCLVFYGGPLLRANSGVSTSQAATAISLFYLGELVGRIAGSGLTRWPGRSALLVVAALGLTTAGFFAAWLSGRVWMAILGLFVAGLGVANLYPLTLALMLAAAPGQVDQATGRVQLLIGMAVLAAPLTLGALADQVGVVRAVSLELALLAVSLLLLLAGRRLTAPTPV
jgi:MFS family permease